MPTFKFEAMDTTGEEVKDQIEALNEEEAQQKIKQMGYFVTKLTQLGEAKKGGKRGKRRGPKKGKTFTIGGVSGKKLCTFTRQFSTLQDAGLPVLRSLKILEDLGRLGLQIIRANQRASWVQGYLPRDINRPAAARLGHMRVANRLVDRRWVKKAGR